MPSPLPTHQAVNLVPPGVFTDDFESPTALVNVTFSWYLYVTTGVVVDSIVEIEVYQTDDVHSGNWELIQELYYIGGTDTMTELPIVITKPIVKAKLKFREKGRYATISVLLAGDK